MSKIKLFLRKLPFFERKQKIEPALNINCSQFEVNNWTISEFIVNKLVKISGVHPYPLAELNLMVAAICWFKPQQVFEWGTNIGKSARVFYEASKAFDIDIEIHSIDLPDDVEHGEHPKKERGYLVRKLSNVKLYQGDGVETSIKLYSKNSALRTLVFIDGDHSYDSVARELRAIIDAMPNAAVLLHDTFYQSSESGYNIGPYRAIIDVLSQYPKQYEIISTNTGLPGMTLIYKRHLI